MLLVFHKNEWTDKIEYLGRLISTHPITGGTCDLDVWSPTSQCIHSWKQTDRIYIMSEAQAHKAELEWSDA